MDALYISFSVDRQFTVDCDSAKQARGFVDAADLFPKDPGMS